jgi:bacteriocin-like protein
MDKEKESKDMTEETVEELDNKKLDEVNGGLGLPFIPSKEDTEFPAL